MIKSRKIFWVLSILLILSLTLVGCGGQKEEPAPKEEVKKEAKAPAALKIGFLGDLTGDTAMYGQNTLDGMKMAVEDINAAGGVLGSNFEIVEADHRYDKAEAANIVQKFVNSDKVIAVIGDPTTGITKATAPIINQGSVVQISAGATGPGVVEIGPFIFRNTLLDTVGGPTTMDYLVNELGWKKVALITAVNNDFSVGLSKIFTSSYVLSMGTTFVILLSGIILALTIFRGLIFKRQLKEIKISALKQNAEELKNYREVLKAGIDHMCKGCLICKDSICLVGYMKALLSDRVTPERFDPQVIESLHNNAFDVSKARQVKKLLEDYYKMYPEEKEKNLELKSIEAILGRIIPEPAIQIHYHKHEA